MPQPHARKRPTWAKNWAGSRAELQRAIYALTILEGGTQQKAIRESGGGKHTKGPGHPHGNRSHFQSLLARCRLSEGFRPVNPPNTPANANLIT